MDQDIQRYTDIVAAYATEAGMKILAAIAFWIIGRWLIGLVGRMLQAALGKQKVDPTLMRYIGSFVAVTLNIVLVVASSATSACRRRPSPPWWPASASPSAPPGAGCCPIWLRARSSLC